MGSIPRIGFDSLPASGVPRGPLPEDQSAAKIAGELSSLAETGAQLAGQDEKFHAMQERRAKEAIQAVANESEAAKSLQDYKEELRGHIDLIKQNNAKTPENVPGEFLDLARVISDADVKDSSNSEIALMKARGHASYIDETLGQLHKWVTEAQTQKAKIDFFETVNGVVRGAEERSSDSDLYSYLKGAAESHASLFSALHEDAAAAKDKMFEQGAAAWVNSRFRDDPIYAAKALDARGGAMEKLLPGDKRSQLRREADGAIDGFGKIKNVEVLKANIHENIALGDAFLEDPTDPKLPGTIGAMENANIEQQKQVRVDPKYTDEQKAEQLEHLQRQQLYYKAFREIVQRQVPLDTTEDVEAATSLLQRRENLFKKDNPTKDLAEADKFLTDLVDAARGKKISGGTFSALFKSLSLDLPKALNAEAKNTYSWPDWQFRHAFLGWSTSPRQAGNKELNRLFEAMPKLTPEQRIAASKNYIRQVNQAVETGGTDPTLAQTRHMAQRAFYLEAGVPMPAGFEK